jgi:hypothetical protein
MGSGHWSARCSALTRRHLDLDKIWTPELVVPFGWVKGGKFASG